MIFLVSVSALSFKDHLVCIMRLKKKSHSFSSLRASALAWKKDMEERLVRLHKKVVVLYLIWKYQCKILKYCIFKNISFLELSIDKV